MAIADLEELKARLRAGRFSLDEVADLASEVLAAIESLQCELEEARKDVERMGFLSVSVMNYGTISADRERDNIVTSPTFGDLPTVSLFTVPSQRVTGIGLCGAIDAAISKVRTVP
jgi:hypothetical protein